MVAANDHIYSYKKKYHIYDHTYSYEKNDHIYDQ